ncbi:hypothetical protein GJ496_006790 [Pomphorhynchus laevis]|nr:hypothetical protein GJ496_006790 [Pomphorhynchus laevis]
MAKLIGLTYNPDKCEFCKTDIKILGYQVSQGKLQPDSDCLTALRDLPLSSNLTSLKWALGLFAYYSSWIPKLSSKIAPLKDVVRFPMSTEAAVHFEELKQDIAKAALYYIDDTKTLTVETDASDCSGHFNSELATGVREVLVRRHDRRSKFDPLVDQAKLLLINPKYDIVLYPNGREAVVSLRDLAPDLANDGTEENENTDTGIRTFLENENTDTGIRTFLENENTDTGI